LTHKRQIEHPQMLIIVEYFQMLLVLPDYSVQRLFGNSDAASNFSMSQLSRDNSAAAAVVESNRTALMAVAAAISAAAASAANERSLSVPPSAHSPSLISRRGPRHSRGPRRSTPSLSESHDSNLNHRKLNSPTNTGANWKSRQPTECDYCKRMFSNKFNLKQVNKLWQISSGSILRFFYYLGHIFILKGDNTL
jgi:hypothetical protein